MIIQYSNNLWRISIAMLLISFFNFSCLMVSFFPFCQEPSSLQAFSAEEIDLPVKAFSSEETKMPHKVIYLLFVFKYLRSSIIYWSCYFIFKVVVTNEDNHDEATPNINSNAKALSFVEAGTWHVKLKNRFSRSLWHVIIHYTWTVPFLSFFLTDWLTIG